MSKPTPTQTNLPLFDATHMCYGCLCVCTADNTAANTPHPAAPTWFVVLRARCAAVHSNGLSVSAVLCCFVFRWGLAPPAAPTLA